MTLRLLRLLTVAAALLTFVVPAAGIAATGDRTTDRGVVQSVGSGQIVLRSLDGPGNRFTGACAYAEGATALGYLVPELMLDQPPRIFRIFASGVTAP